MQRSKVALLYRAENRGRVVGCWRATGRRTTLWRPPGPSFDYGERVTFMKLDRRHAALEFNGGDRQGEFYALRIFDLREGRRRHQLTPYVVERPEGGESVGAVKQIRITTGGSAVWIARCRGCLDVRLHVYEVDRDGMSQLDPGPGVEDGSLTLRDKVAAWRTGGEARTARLQD